MKKQQRSQVSGYKLNIQITVQEIQTSFGEPISVDETPTPLWSFLDSYNLQLQLLVLTDKHIC